MASTSKVSKARKKDFEASYEVQCRRSVDLCEGDLDWFDKWDIGKVAAALGALSMVQHV